MKCCVHDEILNKTFKQDDLKFLSINSNAKITLSSNKELFGPLRRTPSDYISSEPFFTT